MSADPVIDQKVAELIELARQMGSEALEATNGDFVAAAYALGSLFSVEFKDSSLEAHSFSQAVLACHIANIERFNKEMTA